MFQVWYEIRNMILFYIDILEIWQWKYEKNLLL